MRGIPRPMTANLNPHIFRKYDIRGNAERDLHDEMARDLGAALGTFWKRSGAQKIAVGRDCRESSPRLRDALVSGILSTGLNIVDVGVVPTPLVYFTVHHNDLDGGVMVTGSHNPGEDNGFKMMTGKASLFGDDIQTLHTLMEKADFDTGDQGAVTELNILPAYLGFLRGNIAPQNRDLRFAVDAGNGVAGPTVLAAFETLGFEPTALYCEMDGTFPNHHPDPTVESNLEALKEVVLRDGLDFGIAFDGDGDRVGVVDARGQVIWGDKLLTLFARDLLKRHPGAGVLGEVKCSQLLYDDIAAHGGRPILWKTGHSLIKAKMKEEGALLAGEMSGHLFFKDRFFGFDDATYVACRLVELLSDGGPPIHERLSDLPETVITPELRIECADDKKFEVVDAVREHFRQTHELIEVDGARILFGDGAWGLVRASNTGPVLVMRFEAKTQDALSQYRQQVEQVVKRAMA